jgi:hypothetical protein
VSIGVKNALSMLERGIYRDKGLAGNGAPICLVDA